MRLTFNSQDNTASALLESFLSSVAFLNNKTFIRGDRNLALQLRPVVESLTARRPWDDDFVAGDSFQVAIGNPDIGPTAGTFPLSLGGDDTGLTELTLDAAALTLAISAAHSASYGPAQVTLVSDGVYQVAW